MPTIHFRGRILPDHEPITTPPLQEIDWRETTGAKPIRYVITITRSIVNVACTLDSYSPDDDLSIPLIHAIAFSRAALDCLCFGHALGLAMVLEEVVEPDGNVKPLLYKNSRLKKLCTAFDLTPGYVGKDDYSSMYRLISSEPPLFLALGELIVAITVPGHIHVNCARAIEGLRSILVPDDPYRNEGWKQMRMVLRLERSYIDFVIKASAKPRHGDKTFTGQGQAQEILEHSWEIMNRFLEFRKRGSVPLPEAQFSILK